MRASLARPTTRFRNILACAALGLLSACGGSSAPSSPDPDPSGSKELTAAAGPDRRVAEGAEAVLDGSASRAADGGALSYFWRQTAGLPVDLRDADRASAHFTAPQVNADTGLRFRLTVTDSHGDQASDDVVLTVANRPQGNAAPSVDAGSDQSVSPGAEVVLAGSAEDTDGSITEYRWTQLSGPAVTLAGAQTPTARFTAPAVTTATTLTFRLQASDDRGAYGSDDVNVVVTPANANRVPVADAGADQQADEGTRVTLDGSASHDPDGSLSGYAWTQVAGPQVVLDGADTVRPQFTAPGVDADTELRFSLRVTDDAGAESPPDEVAVIVRNVGTANQAPVADAGDDIAVASGASVSLDGSRSFDPDGDIGGYAWRQDAGPAVTLQGADTAAPGFTAPTVDSDTVLGFELRVTDAQGAAGTDRVEVTVQAASATDPTLSIEGGSVAEGNFLDTRLQFTVRLSAPSNREVSVALQTADVEAEAGTDYAAASATLSFSPGQTEQSFEVTVHGDVAEESDEHFAVVMSAPVNAVLQNTRALGLIIDDDAVKAPACAVDGFCVGAARQSVTPTQQQIDGIEETRLYVGTKTQKFNLGGYGIDPIQNFPEPFAAYSDDLTQPAEAPVHHSEVHGDDEDIYVRVMALAQGGQRVLFVMLDAIGAGNVIQRELRALLVEASCAVDACVEADNIVFGQTHSHAGPDLQGLWGGVPQQWIRERLYAQAGEATLAALRGLQPATLQVAQGHSSDFNNYRRPRVDPADDADDAVTLLRAVDANGGVIAQVLQYAAHPTSIDEDPRVPHADYVLGAMKRLEQDGGVGLYYNGPIADASPSGGQCTTPDPDAYERVRCRGNDLAAFAGALSFRTLDPALAVRHQTVILPVTNPLFVGGGLIGSFNRYYDFTPREVASIPVLGDALGEVSTELGQVAPTAETLVSRISIGGAGGLEIATIPGEATNTYGQFIRQLAATANPGADLMLLGLTQNSFGYIIPEEEFSYVDPTGDAGFIVPFTGYEEFVSLGPLTAPLLRMEGYIPLFDADPSAYLPDYLAACVDPAAHDCLLTDIALRIDSIQSAYAQTCRDAGAPAEFCDLIDPQTPLAQPCADLGLPEALCGLLGDTGGGGGDADLADDAALALLAGCDMLDPAHCLFPFPNDHFTTAAPDGSPQSQAAGGTGLRIDFNPLAMPRNIAGKPIDPTEWNRNDGFSPGQIILTYVPGLGTVKDAEGQPLGPVAGAVPLTDLSRYADPDAQVIVLDTGPIDAPYPVPVRHLVWAEIDLNAGKLIPGFSDQPTLSPNGKRPALIIRPARNFDEAHRYVVVLQHLRDDNGQPIEAGAAFGVCRDQRSTLLPPLAERCSELQQKVFPVLEAAGIAVRENAGLYLAWDFTTASSRNNVARLKAIRDDAFAALGDALGSAPGDADYPAGQAPGYQISKVTPNPDGPSGRTVRRIEGTITVPSYVVPADPSPLDSQPELQAQLDAVLEQFPDVAGELVGACRDAGVPVLCDVLGLGGDLVDIVGSASLPPNRLFYDPTDAPNPADPLGSLYGDGLPDRNPLGDLTFTFTCDIPRAAVAGAASMELATEVVPVRPTLYGHGLLGGQGEVNGQASDFGNVYGFLNCAADWFGFASGDLANVASVLLDLSNFPVIPDGSQQGMLNQMFLARLLTHPQGFAADPLFQVGGQPVFDRREVFYHGNSQGGILGGALVAISKDVNRGVLGVPGMNYSTLLTRSTDFATYSVPLYLAYPDDLDRDLGFALMQMLWDRSENNGYVAHLRDNAVLDGPDNEVLLHPAFGDHQVSMWTADVMARSIGAPVDRRRVIGADRHPDDVEFYALAPIDYGNAAQAAGSALVYWDEPWDSQLATRCDGAHTAAPPIGNLPPGDAAGDDPHECPRRDAQARCQMSHFLLRASAAPGDSTARLIDPATITFGTDDAGNCPGVIISDVPGVSAGGGVTEGYGEGVTALVAQLSANAHDVIDATLAGDVVAAQQALQTSIEDLAADTLALGDAASPEALLGLARDIPGTVLQALSARRDVEAVVLTGAQLSAWSVPAAFGTPNPYPSGALLDQCPDPFDAACDPILEQLRNLVPNSEPVRDAHNGTLLYPLAGLPAPGGTPVDEIAAYAWSGDAWHEIPVQVDERMPYFLANGNSTFSIYSGTDSELSYVWDTEAWGMTQGTCSKAYDGDAADNGVNEGVAVPTPDPIAGLDADDEIVFMAADAGELAPVGSTPDGVDGAGQQVALVDPLDPSTQRFVYLFRKAGGSSFRDRQTYVRYARAADADEWIDRRRFADDDPEKLGTSNTNYGANLTGTVCVDSLAQYHGDAAACSFDVASGRYQCPSSDRFPRDAVTVSTDQYRWQSSGRWMVRDLRIRAPGETAGGDAYWQGRPDLIDRWKGRAFQQSPDSVISLVGFEDEQVNWEGNASLLGERCGPVRCIRETWGADSGTNVTKTETFYRDAIAYRYRVRVHPIPPDGLYTSWDYNRSAMVPTAEEASAGVAGGRYYTLLRPQGVPIDGINDDVGNVDGFVPLFGFCPSSDGVVPPNADGRCPAFVDVPDPTFNPPLAFDNWEQVSAKGDGGSLVYTFLLRGATTLLNPLVVPYYRDDACLDDGTGDDPVPRPYPGDDSGSDKVRNAYVALARDAGAAPDLSYDDLRCDQRQGAHAAHGLHFFVTHDSDNAFTPLTATEIDGEQWQFIAPTAQPQNVAEPYANVARFPLQAVVTPLP